MSQTMLLVRSQAQQPRFCMQQLKAIRFLPSGPRSPRPTALHNSNTGLLSLPRRRHRSTYCGRSHLCSPGEGGIRPRLGRNASRTLFGETYMHARIWR